ncbi:MAG: hypothetical protein JXP72_02405 [Coriobacteriia bacterium]|nr:hypothetical protein [Coriobacteriia bacterium]
MRALARIVFALAVVCALPARAFAVTPSGLTGADLVTAGSGLEGAEVTFEGEVVSEALSGGEGHVWINVLSGGVAIGVWVPAEMAEDLTSFGRWSHDGDIVRVTGNLNEACDTHGGDLDVHATALVVVDQGQPRDHPIQYWKLIPGIVGVAAAHVSIQQARRREERPS